jgi:hypothetical protein
MIGSVKNELLMMENQRRTMYLPLDGKEFLKIDGDR